MPYTPIRAGQASILGHHHDENLWKLRSFVTTGSLAQTTSGWVFTPERYLPGASPDPRALLRSRRTAERYLAARQLPRPVVPWAAYRQLYNRPELAEATF